MIYKDKSLLDYVAAAIVRVSDQDRIIVRSAAISGENAERMRDEALMSGALPGEFEVVHVYRRGCGYSGMEARLR
jgi:hypothetical protein